MIDHMLLFFAVFDEWFFCWMCHYCNFAQLI